MVNVYEVVAYVGVVILYIGAAALLCAGVVKEDGAVIASGGLCMGVAIAATCECVLISCETRREEREVHA